VLVIFFGALLGNLLSSHMLAKRSDGLYSGGATWGDLAWHLTLLTRFAEKGLSATGENPVLPGKELSYPFVPDLLSGVLLRSGIGVQASLIWPTLAVLVLSVVVLYIVANRMAGGRFGGFTVPFLLVFNGSVVGCYYLWKDYRASKVGAVFFNDLPADYTHLRDHNIHFSNLISEYFLPQRAAGFGFLLGLVVVWFFWRYWERSDRSWLLWAGLILSAMPLIHFHSFVSLCLVAGFLFLIQFSTDISRWKFWLSNWAFFVLPIAVIALPITLWILPSDTGHFIRVQIGWMSEQGSTLWFWIKNLTPHLFVFALAYYFARRKLRLFFLGFCGVFVLGNVLIFQPNAFDNLKLFFWWFLAGCLLTGRLFQELARRYSYRGVVMALVLMATMVASGAASVWRELHLSWRMFSTEDVVLAEYIKANTGVDAIFLTSDKHNHPVACLAGRRIVMGYRGWLWTHGVDYRSRERDVFDMYAGTANANALLKNYAVQFVLFEKDRTAEFHVNPQFLETRFPAVYRSENYTLFKVAP